VLANGHLSEVAGKGGGAREFVKCAWIIKQEGMVINRISKSIFQEWSE